MTRNKRRVLLSAMGMTVVAGVIVFFGLREPRCNGRPISEWIPELVSVDPDRRRAGADVLQEANDSCVAWLIQRMSGSDSRLRSFFSRQNLRVGRPGHMVAVMPSGEYQRGLCATALGIIGPRALEAEPALNAVKSSGSMFTAAAAQAALVRMKLEKYQPDLKMPNDAAEIRQFVKRLSVLSLLGTNISSMQQELTQSLRTNNVSRGFELVEILCQEKLEPGVVWPLIIALLEDPALSALRANALNAAMIHLGGEGSAPVWKERVRSPVVQCLIDTNRGVRLNAFAVILNNFPPEPSLIPTGIVKQIVLDPDIGLWATEMLKSNDRK